MKSRNISVLVIDDDSSVTTLVSTLLRRSGFTVSSATQARDAFRLAHRIQPDVVLCDAAMPELSGPQVIEALKADPATAEIPVVLMTGIADAHMFAHARWTGFLGKPFDREELCAAVRSAIASRVPPKLQ